MSTEKALQLISDIETTLTELNNMDTNDVDTKLDSKSLQNRNEFYDDILPMIEGIIEGETDYIANCANVSSIIYNESHAI